MKRSRKDFDRDTLLAQLRQAQLGEQAALARETTAKQDLAIRMGTATIVRSHAEASDMNCGSLETCSIDEILEGVPSVDDALIRERFAAMCAEKPVLPTVSDREIPAMHTFMERVLWLARPATSVLSIRHELKARVRDSKSSVIPDFSLSHRRNATFSMHTMDFCLELKRRRHRRKKRRLVLRGNAQAMDYATRKAEHSYDQLFADGSALKAIALSAFSDGESITFKRVELSRNPADAVRPVRKMTSEPLKLLPQSVWNKMTWPDAAPLVIPAGFCALVRILSATSADLGNRAELLDSVDALLPRTPDPITLTLTKRLGLGGFGDVYAVKRESLSRVGLRARAVVKIPRSRSLVARKLVVAEARALVALGQWTSGSAAPHAGIPVLLSRAPQDIPLWDPSLVNCKFPSVLVLAPRGRPVENVLSDLLQTQQEGFARRVFANHIANGVLSALRFAHTHGWVHLDVRPSNIVLVRGKRKDWLDCQVVLVDWALAVRIGSRLNGLRGVPDFVHNDIISSRESKWQAAPFHDVFAVACTFAALAFGDVIGDHAYAPWDGHRVGVDSVVPLRGAWFSEKKKSRRRMREFMATAAAYSANPASVVLPAL